MLMELRSQKQTAAKLMKCGVSRVWIDPARIGDAHQAITAEDIRRLIKDGIISKKQKKGLSTFKKKKVALQKRKGRRKGEGSRKGSLGSRYSRKQDWMNRVRSQRKFLKDMLKDQKIEKEFYKELYRKSKGGFFRNVGHLKSYIEKESKKQETKRR